ncbi:hypothetical protein B5M09_001013 [Aphanomyces astaci]|uniref:HTH psq-type domain-containing protein n=1 Tax=Aphanomyces astaci TaxID=112090 RepID=A0A3R7WM27_APHAT|nr:hypothetical protein B5M09_001013 [Aphanomyces astaci]
MPSDICRSRSKSGQRKVITLRHKVRVIQAYEAATGPQKTFYSIGKEFGVQTGQVSRWVNDKAKIMERAMVNPSAFTVNPGRSISMPHVEAEVLKYFHALQEDDIAKNTDMLIIHALSIDPDFHSGVMSALRKWVYHFMERNNLAIRRPTRQAQKRSSHMNETLTDFADNLMDRFKPFGTLENVSKHFFVNMDETSVPFQPDVKTTIALKGSKTVSVRKNTSTNSRVSVCLAIAMDGTKLPPFVVFKGVPGARIDSNLDTIVQSVCSLRAKKRRGWTSA